jgi:hypothetical protein
MIDREDEVKQFRVERVKRFPQDLLQVIIYKVPSEPSDNITSPNEERIIGSIYISNDKEYEFWKSTLKIMNEKLQRRELSI